jgi:Putative MetA-pathway of phenol degradation
VLFSVRTRASSVDWGCSCLCCCGGGGRRFTTDDPEPVEYRHWELYLASQHQRDSTKTWSGTAPHFEVNYGVVPDVQLHIIAPFSYSAPNNGVAHYGYGDTELGVKFRFLQERTWTPMIGTFPFLEVPTGSQGAGLGNGSAQVFLPVWVQKGFGSWQTYGGAGLWIDLGDRYRHWWYFGWQVQRRLGKALTLGAEIFHQTPDHPGGESDSRFNVGAIIDVSETHHLLLSAGRGFNGPNRFQGYGAWLLTFK